MKVLHIITGLADGGAEAVLYRLVCHDPDDQHHVVSLTTEGKYGPLLREAGVEVTALAMPRGRLTAAGLRGLWRTVRLVQPDLVQTWMYHADLLGGLVGRMTGVPVVWGIRHTTLEPGKSARNTRVVARLCAWLSRWLPVRIVACAEAAVEVHAALGYDRHRMVVIPNGYDLSCFAPDDEARKRLRDQWQVPDDLLLIGMVARFDPQKDHGNLIAALADVARRGVRFCAVLVGSAITPENRELSHAVQAAGLSERVWLLGPRTDVPAVMNALDVHVLSSAAEAFPNVLAEAMACGTPCVATDVGDAARIVGETGWIVPPKDSAALAQAILAALTAHADRESWRKRQWACRARIAEHFSIEAMVQRYRAVWREAVKMLRKGETDERGFN
ncbi:MULTISPECIES: glycosyltransferase [unclassified Thermosynechococcus]|uniref:glycosyltransferase n=1 Tax=unclassified Thermosynechococcus TaxID=2622553 RepID=UPI0026727C8C|nr:MULTISPECIES: glycosyltransferase [unclassified Thermosynechococcus]WKT82984.1 glycosyltransferase [Thermosynechococcus sp. HY596]WNC62112.1 glycosyltransferase [Thermosynechococcus sp. HY591]WNC64665.1 glycosyltransferase [Thermosynechococcus sp. HY593]